MSSTISRKDAKLAAKLSKARNRVEAWEMAGGSLGRAVKKRRVVPKLDKTGLALPLSDRQKKTKRLYPYMTSAGVEGISFVALGYLGTLVLMVLWWLSQMSAGMSGMFQPVSTPVYLPSPVMPQVAINTPTLLPGSGGLIGSMFDGAAPVSTASPGGTIQAILASRTVAAPVFSLSGTFTPAAPSLWPTAAAAAPLSWPTAAPVLPGSGVYFGSGGVNHSAGGGYSSTIFIPSSGSGGSMVWPTMGALPTVVIPTVVFNVPSPAPTYTAVVVIVTATSVPSASPVVADGSPTVLASETAVSSPVPTHTDIPTLTPVPDLPTLAPTDVPLPDLLPVVTDEAAL